ncbi:MAG: hypothetical protein HZA49_05580 [Planctomycetes bacterium]|nr:hypothetical protein [Planctomycetota bacterium]
MDINESFQSLISGLIPSESILETARQHCDYIKQILNNDPDLSPKKFFYSGSYAKDTCISPLKDVDLSPHYDLAICKKPNGEFYMPGIVLGKFFTRFKQTFPQLPVRRQRRSIGIRFTDCDVEIVPVFWDGNDKYLSNIPDRDAKKWIKTSIPMHVEFFKKRDLSYRPYGKTIRLLKWWKKVRAVPLKGFALELLCVKALDKFSTSAHFGLNFSNVMRYVCESKLNDIVWFNDNFLLSQVRVAKSPIMIIDPVNPTNNVTKDLTMFDKQRILIKCNKAYKQSLWALKAEEKGRLLLARMWWRAIFGSSFPVR